jgi:ferrochelatase
MMNLGGPSTLAEVEPFLNRLLSDKDLIRIPFQEYSGPLIAKNRSVKVKKQYEQIGGGSPLRKWTNIQGNLMCQKLDKILPATAPHKHYMGFRYADPMIFETIQQMKKDGVKRVIGFSQYPQYSCSTTGSSLNELYRQLVSNNLLNEFEWTIIDRWPTHNLLAKAFAEQIRQALETHYTDEERKDVVLLFSAHSLPLSVVNRGDAYAREVATTVQKVMEELNYSHTYTLVWQSKVGPATWLQPSTDSAIRGFADKGLKNLLLIPIAFTSDHIETLYEYDILYHELGQKVNIKLRRASALNDHPIFIDALVDIVSNHLSNKEKCTNQLNLRCATCDKPECVDMRRYFTKREGVK